MHMNNVVIDAVRRRGVAGCLKQAIEQVKHQASRIAYLRELPESALLLPALASLLILGAVYATSYSLLLRFIGPLSGSEPRTLLQWLQAPAALAGESRRA